MLDSKHVKNLGLQFARALQVAIKTAAVFPIEHKSSERPIQQSFDFLNGIVKIAAPFTLGFIDKEVMLNKILTADSSLRPLEAEFTKRGIAAITFESELTFTAYRKLVYLFAAPSANVESAGGFLPYWNQNPLDGLRIVAAKKQNKNEHGDTIIEQDSESYILARQRSEHKTQDDFLDSIEALLESGCFDPATRAEALANLASGDRAPGNTPASNYPQPGFGVTGGTNAGVAGSGGTATGAAPARTANPSASPATFLQLVEQSVQRSLCEENGNPQKSLLSLARLLSNTGVDRILERFPAESREELSRLKPEQLAAEYMGDKALQIAGSKLQSPGGANQLAVEQEVLEVLSRALQATQMADRMAAKLTQFIKDFAIPPHVQEKIREELQWTSYPLNKKVARIMELPRYSNLEFRRFMETAKDLLAQRDLDRAATIVNHYFEFLDAPNAPLESSDLSRVPEIVQALVSAHAGFSAKTAERLARVLRRTDLSEFIHFQAANALGVLGRALVIQEEFQQAVTIGLMLEKSHNQDRERHKKCCGTAIAALIPPVAIERILENHLQKRGDSAAGKTTATLLRLAAPASIQNVMQRLVEEGDARNRLALVRLAGQLGDGSIEVAVKYLADDRWYVVRNMCVVLAELRDPQLAEHIAPALRHADARVQQAALKTLTKGHAAKTAQVLADSLFALAPQVLDEALDQLMYMKSPSTIAALENFASSSRSNVVRATKTLQALGAIADPAALYALGRIFRIEELDPMIRRAALAAISSQNSAAATQLLHELSTSWGALAEDAKKELAKRQPKQI